MMRRNWRERSAVLAAALLFLLVRSSDARAQVAPLPAWKVLADESSAVVVADVVEGLLNVIDPEKKAKVETTPDGKLSFGNPALFTVGILARERIENVIKGDGKIRQGDTVRVFIYGYIGSDRPHFATVGEKLVLFLRPLDPNGKEFIPAVIQRTERIEQNGHPRYIEHRDKFDPKGCYTPVEEGYAQVVVPPDKLDRIDKIKQAIAKGP